VLDQNNFVAQVNSLYNNTMVTRASQLWIRGFADASSWLLFSRIFGSWMCENSSSYGNSKGRNRMHWSFRVMRQHCSVSSYIASHKKEIYATNPAYFVSSCLLFCLGTVSTIAPFLWGL